MARPRSSARGTAAAALSIDAGAATAADDVRDRNRRRLPSAHRSAPAARRGETADPGDDRRGERRRGGGATQAVGIVGRPQAWARLARPRGGGGGGERRRSPGSVPDRGRSAGD